MPLHQSERLVQFDQPEKVENELLVKLLLDEKLLDPQKKKKTVYFRDNIHTHEITAEPIQNDQGFYYILTWSDKEHMNPGKLYDGDFGIRIKYYPDENVFEPISLTNEVSHNPVTNLNEQIVVLHESSMIINETLSRISVGQPSKVIGLGHNLNKVVPGFYERYPELYKFGKFSDELVKTKLNQLAAEIENKIHEIEIDYKYNSNRLVKFFCSQLSVTVYESYPDEDRKNPESNIKFTKNPTQAQVLKMKREFALKDVK